MANNPFNFHADEDESDEYVPVRRRRPKRSRRDDDDNQIHDSGTRWELLFLPALGAIIFGLLMAIIGVILSQYWPVFGGFLEQNLAEPWSPARISLIPIHVFVFGLVGVILGGVCGLLIAIALKG